MKDYSFRLPTYIPYTLLFVAIFLILGILLGLLYYEYEEEVVQRVYDQGFSILNQVENEILDQFTAYRTALQKLSTRQDIITTTDQGKQILKFYYELNQDEISAISRVDRNGKVVYTYPERPELIGTNISNQLHVQKIQQTQKPVLSDIFQSIQGYNALAYHYPIFFNGTFDGSVAILIPFTTVFEKKLSQVELTKGGKAWLVSGDGIILHSPFKSDYGASFFEQYKVIPSFPKSFERINSHQADIHTFLIPNNGSFPFEPGLYDIVHKPLALEDSYWDLFFITPRKVVVADMQSFLTSIVLIIISIFVMVSFFILLLFRQRNQIQEKQIQVSIERAIGQEKAQLVSVLESMESLVFVIDPDDKYIIYANPTAKKYFGENVLGQSCHTIFLKKDEACPKLCIIQDIIPGETQTVKELFIQTINHHFQIFSKRISWQSGGEKILIVMNDITEQKTLDLMLHQAREKLGILNSITSNEIMNQIFILGGYFEIVREAQSDEERILYHNKCHESLKKVEELVKYLQAYQGLGQSHPKWQNVNEITIYAFSHLSSRSIAHVVTTGSLEIYADPLLELGFEQLIRNSIIHGKSVDTITLSASIESKSEDLLLSYTDNGQGIEPENKEKIFNKGYASGQGSGLGLFLVREILSITGIEIHETGVYQEGARFEMKIPKGAYRYDSGSD